MTTTRAKDSGKQPANEPIGDGWDDAPKASSGETSDSPEWCPHFASFKDEVVQAKLSTKAEGSHTRPVVVGALKVMQAFGEPRYFVDETRDGKTVTMAIPNHNALTSTLDKIRISPAPTIRIAFQGEAKNSKPGQRAAYLYDVRVKPSEALLPEARKDACLPAQEKRRAERKARDEANDD